MAALLKSTLGIDTVDLESGGRGEFTVRVGQRRVVEKTGSAFPAEDEIVERVRAAL